MRLKILLAKSKSVISGGNVLDVKDCPLRVRSGLILGRISNQSLFISEGNIRRCYSVTLIVCEDFDSALLHHTDAGVRSP